MKKNLFNQQNTKNFYKQIVLLLILFFSGNVWGQISIAASGTAYTENFNSIGTSATASLPAGWKAQDNNSTTRAWGTANVFSATVTAGNNSTAASSGSFYNWGDATASSDRAIGFLSAGSGAWVCAANKPLDIYAQYKNDTGNAITKLDISFDYEKYRNSNTTGSAGWKFSFYYSTDGSTWTSVSSGDNTFAADGNTSATNPLVVSSKTFSITGLNIANGSNIYLRWSYFVASGTTYTNSAGLGLDNVSVTATTTASPACTVPVSQPASLVFGTTSSSAVNATFTGVASPNTPSGYLILRSTSNVAPTPVDGSNYGTGSTQTFGGNSYYVLQGSAAASLGTTITDTGLGSNTTYYYYIYSYNSGCTGQPYYLKTSPLTDSRITCPVAPTVPLSNPTSSGATVSWTASAVGGSAETIKYRFELYTDSGRTNAVVGYPLTDTTSPVTVSGLSSNTTYYYRIIAYNSSCQSTNLDGSFTTTITAGTFPYTDDFEGVNNWTLLNTSQTNKWIVSTAVANGGTKSMYISNTGTTHNYSTSAASISQAYRDITIPAGTTFANVGFDWRANGEGTTTKYDFVAVWLVPASYTPTAGVKITPTTGFTKIGDFNLVNTWGTSNTLVDISSFAGQNMRLVFEWNNDSSAGSQAPAAIDNINISLPPAATTVSPTTLSGFTATTASDSSEKTFTVSGVSLGTTPITITPPAGYQISTTSGSGYSSTPIVLNPTSGSVASTNIYVILKKGATGSPTGNITVSASPAVTPDKTVALSGTISKATFTSATTGNWETAASWDLNAVPGTDDNVVILAAHTITATTAQTRNSGTTTTVAGTLAINDHYTNNGTTTINGSFQINAGSWATGTDFVYGAASTLIFGHNNGSVYGVNADAYWPSAGPFNVTVNGNSPISLNVARTVNGTFNSSATITNPGNITIGTSGTLKLNSGYGWSGTGSPIYGTSSTLIYNSGGSPGRNNEWTASTGTVGTTAGLPQNVQVSNNTILNFPNGNTASGSSTAAFMAGGIVTIDAGSSLYQDYGPGGNSALIVGGNLVLNGNLSLGNAEGGNITVGGNWTQAASATFSPKGRRVIFNGTAAQTITKTGGGTLDFDRLEIQKTNTTNVSLSNSAGNLTSLNLNGTYLNALAIIGSGTGGLNLNANTLTFNNDGGDIYVDAAKTIVASSGAVINFNANKKVSNNSGTGSLTFAANATININNNATVDFGKSSGTNISTVNGVLNIVGNGSSVTPNGPIYATGSKLVYKTAGIYARKAEWNANSGAGYPYDVQVTANTTLNYPNTGSGAFSTALGIARDLTIDSGSSLYMDYGNGGNKNGSLTVGRNIVNSGSLSLGDFAGGDLSLGGSWTSSGTFVPNNRTVTFNGSDGNDQTIYSPTTFDYLTINKTSTGNVVLAASIIVNKDLTLTNKSIVLGTNNLTLPNNTSIISSNANSYIQAIGTGKLIRQNIDGTKDWTFPMGVSAAGRYAPIIIKNLSGTTDLSVNVSTSITPTVSDATRVLSTKWFVTTTNIVTANIYTEWQGVAAETNSMTIPATGSLATTVGGAPYTFYNINLVANNTTATGVSLSNTAANGIVIGNDNAVSIANDECSGAINITVDAAAVSGSNKGATSSSGFGASPCSSGSNSRDVWYKFTTSDEGSYKITVFKSTGTGAMSDPVLDLRSGTCAASVNIGCSDGLGDEVVTLSLNANTTYYYRIFNYGSASGDGFFTTSVSTVPNIIVTPVNLNFGNVPVNTDSTVQDIKVKASFLSPANGNVSIAALAGYSYSLDGTSWSSTLTLPYTSKTLAETTVHVKLSPTAGCTDYNGNIAISGGGATTVNVAATGKGVIPAPTATAATDVVTNGFIANWNAVTGATGYVIDVGTSPDFGTYSATTATEGFETGMPTSGYNTGTFTLSTGDWSLVNALKSTTASNNYNSTAGGCQLQASTSASATSPSYNQITSVKFHAKSGTSGTNLAVYKIVGGLETLVQNVSLTTTVTQYTVNINETANDVKIKFVNGSATSYVDNVIITYSVLTPSFVSPYNNYAVSGTSQTISGLATNTTYYYRVRATSGSCQSANSNTIDVTTNNTIIWNNAWTNTSGPDATLDAIIRTPFNVGDAGQNEFSVKNLTIEGTGSLDIKAGKGITVTGDITAPDNKIIIESDGSLVQTKITNGNSANKAIVKRGVSMKTSDYTYWSSPVKDQPLLNTSNVNANNSAGGFSEGTPNNRIFEYNEPNDTFKATLNGTFTNAKGYAIRGKSSYGTSLYSDELWFKGNLNNGDITIGVQKSKNTIISGITYEHGYNLIGNPYPSNIDFYKFYNLDKGDGTKNSNVIFGKVWFWTNVPGAPTTQGGSSYTPNNYATLTLAGGVNATDVYSATGSPTPNQYIKVAQGFIVQMRATPPTGSTPVTGTVKFDNSIRTNDNTGHFYNDNKNSASDEINRYWLKMISPYNISNTILIAHMDGATNQYDADYDAELLSVGDDSFYSKINTQKLHIQARSNPISDEDFVALGAKYSMNGTYKISLGNREGIFVSDQKIYLRDKLTGTYTDLTSQDYTFSTSKGTDENRFEIVYKNKEVLGTDILNKSDFIVYRDGNYFVIKSSANLGKIELYDVSGKLIQSKYSSEKSVRMDVNTLSSGVYIIKAENSGNVRTKKIIK